MQSVKTAIGLMSGTSMDGIDAALIRSDGENHLEILAHGFFDYPQSFRRELKEGLATATLIKVRHERPGNLALLEKQLTLYHAQIVQHLLSEQNWKADNVDLIGFHGQTILHRPDEGLTVQLGHGKDLAHQTGINVISDMRANDMAYGGQGAPLTPAYHAVLSAQLQDKLNFPCCFINIGGIANLTYIPKPDKDLFANIMAFDCGPGNCLIDQWMENRAATAFDKGGQTGLRGQVDKTILKSYLKQSIFSSPHPKSFDWRDFPALICDQLPLEDGAATLAHITALAIIHSFRFLPLPPKTLIVSGGGCKNLCLMTALEEQAHQVGAALFKAEECGLNPDFIEAEAWGYLAIRSYLGLPLSFPATTGVKFATTGGIFSPALP